MRVGVERTEQERASIEANRLSVTAFSTSQRSQADERVCVIGAQCCCAFELPSGCGHFTTLHENVAQRSLNTRIEIRRAGSTDRHFHRLRLLALRCQRTRAKDVCPG